MIERAEGGLVSNTSCAGSARPGSRAYRILILVALATALGACSGGVSGAEAPAPGPGAPDTTTTPAGPPPQPTKGAAVIPADFPIPIADGGTIESEHLGGGSYGEVTVSYPESEYEALVAFYQDFVNDQGGSGGELFPSGFEWQVQDSGLTVIRVTPEPPPWVEKTAVAVLFIQRTR
jgi:hypothetical protein